MLRQGQGAGLIEDDGVEIARLLQPPAIPNQETISRTERGGDGDDEGDGEAQRMGTGDDQHGDEPFHGV